FTLRVLPAPVKLYRTWLAVTPPPRSRVCLPLRLSVPVTLTMKTSLAVPFRARVLPMSPLMSITLRPPLPVTIVAALTVPRVCVGASEAACDEAFRESLSAWARRAGLMLTEPERPELRTWPTLASVMVPVTVLLPLRNWPPEETPTSPVTVALLALMRAEGRPSTPNEAAAPRLNGLAEG